jgi:DeoR/GlpR family transcriptional regulator of sugar metabolism
MSKNEREQKILELLEEHRFISVDELSSRLYISPSSIRRDLISMQTRGLVVRNYGGVMLCESRATAAPLSLRMETHKTEKKQIARLAASLLHDHMTVFLDGSTTASYLVDHIAEHSAMTVITNNLQTAMALIERGVETYCLGGRALPSSTVTCGGYAEEMLENFHGDIFFFSSFALSDQGVITDCTAEENALRKKMLTRADCRVFLCDSSKFRHMSTHRLCTVNDVEYCFYDTPPKIEL